MTLPSNLPESTETAEERKKLAALGHVLRCHPEMAREVTRGRKAEQDLWERIEALERMVQTLTTLVVGKKK